MASRSPIACSCRSDFALRIELCASSAGNLEHRVRRQRLWGRALNGKPCRSARNADSGRNEGARGSVGTIWQWSAVRPGDTIPSNPRHVFKLRLNYAVTPQLSVGGNLLASVGVYARGDENNQDVNGRLPGYALVNVDARYRVSSAFEVFARVNNVFDRRYFNFGVVGESSPARPRDPVNGAQGRRHRRDRLRRCSRA